MDAARSKLSKNDEYRESGGIYINGKYLQEKDYNNKDAQRAYSKAPDKRKVNDYARVQNREKKNYTSKPTYSSTYDPYLFERLMGTISPSQQIGAIFRGLRDTSGLGFAHSYFDAMYGLKDTKDAFQNKGIFSVSQGGENFANNHQNIAAGTNFLFDAAVGGAASEGKLGQFYKPNQVKLANSYDVRVGGTNWLGRPRVVEGETIVPRYVQKTNANGQFTKGFQQSRAANGQFGHRAYQKPAGDYYMDNNLTYSPAQAVAPTAAGTVGRQQTAEYFDSPGYSTGEIVIAAKPSPKVQSNNQSISFDTLWSAGIKGMGRGHTKGYGNTAPQNYVTYNNRTYFQDGTYYDQNTRQRGKYNISRLNNRYIFHLHKQGGKSN